MWDNVPEPTQPPIAISRIFCGQITKATPSNLQVYGFGSSMYASETGGNLCLYKGGIKDIPCYTVKGQRMVAVGKGKWMHAVMHAMKYMHPIINFNSRQIFVSVE